MTDTIATAVDANLEIAGPSTKKRKRDGERARVTRACDRCKRRKVKCNGHQPCEFCSRAAASCTFETAYSRGRVPSIPRAPALDLSLGSDETVAALRANRPSFTGLRPPVLDMSGLRDLPAIPTNNGNAPTRPPDGSTNALYTSNGHSQRSSTQLPVASPSVAATAHRSPAESQTGLHGHYIGPASGVSFLQRVQNRLGQAVSFSHPDSIFTFGDAPLVKPEVDLSFCIMVPREDAQKLIDRYFEFAMPTYRFLHRPTIQTWFVEFYETFGAMREASTAPARVALLLMVLAHGRVYMPDDDKPGPHDLSNRLYLTAEQQLEKESGSIRLTSIQTRLTQCFYLLTQSRINHCWSLFGTVSHLALATGLNRSRRSDSALNQIEAECRRRTFWCAYTLDVYLSVVLGRPHLFHDADIDTELPSCIEDKDLTETQLGSAPNVAGPSIMQGVLAQFNLARIVKSALRELYPLKPISTDQRAFSTHEHFDKLRTWRANLAMFVDPDYVGASWLMPIIQRQRNVLNLTYWHAIILIHRPYLLNNYTTNRQANGMAIRDMQGDEHQTAQSAEICLSAAMSTVNTINDMMQTRQISRVFWTAAYFAFTASIVLYIHVLQTRLPAPETHDHYLSAATLCQSHIASLADKGSLPERYCLLLEELRLESVRQTDRMRQTHGAGAHAARTPHMPQTEIPNPAVRQGLAFAATAGDAGAAAAAAAAANEDFNALFPDEMPEYADWGQFASMVSSGLGNLDVFLNEDPFVL